MHMHGFMKTKIATSLFLTILATWTLSGGAIAQNQNNNPNQGSGQQNSTTEDGWRGFLNIDYKGGRFIAPYSRIVSVSNHDYIVDGGGRVYELTIDTTGGVVARFYFLESLLENSPFKAGQIINNRIKSTQKMAEGKSGQDTRSVIKHYPDTTHAKMVEFNVSHKRHLELILDHLTREWIEEGGRGPGRTLRFE